VDIANMAVNETAQSGAITGLGNFAAVIVWV
jgi:hypothetical protein